MPPPEPLHLLGQQILALTLQQGAIGRHLWREWFGPEFSLDSEAGGRAEEVIAHLMAERFVHVDHALLTMGTEGDRAFGSRHFMDLTASFAAPPVFSVLAGRHEIGVVERDVLLAGSPRASGDTGPRVLLLGGRAWAVGHIAWDRRPVQVEPTDRPGEARWRGGLTALSFELCRTIRDVLAGADPPVALTDRARSALSAARDEHPWFRRGDQAVETGHLDLQGQDTHAGHQPEDRVGLRWVGAPAGAGEALVVARRCDRFGVVEESVGDPARPPGSAKAPSTTEMGGVKGGLLAGRRRTIVGTEQELSPRDPGNQTGPGSSNPGPVHLSCWLLWWRQRCQIDTNHTLENSESTLAVASLSSITVSVPSASRSLISSAIRSSASPLMVPLCLS